MNDLTSALSTFCLISGSSSAQIHAHSWTPEAILETRIISDVQISPDNQEVLFVSTQPQMDEEKGTLLSRIYKARLSHPKDLCPFSMPAVSSSFPRWSPDGKWIAFLSTRSGTKQLYVIPSSGGEATEITHGKKDVQTFSWSPDSSKIAFVMEDATEPQKQAKPTSLAYSYEQPTSVHRLWIIDFKQKQTEAAALTSDDYHVRGTGDFGTCNVEFDWSPDSQTIAFAYSPKPGFDAFYLESHLASVEISTGRITPWTIEAPYEALPRYSPQGDLVAYLRSDSIERYSASRQVALRTPTGTFASLLSKTFNEGPFLAGPSLLGWTREGDGVLFFEPKGTKFHLVKIPSDGSSAEEWDTKGVFFKEPSFSRDQTLMGCVVQAPDTPPEACIASFPDFKVTQVSHLNTSFLSYPRIQTERISWTSVDNFDIEGLLSYPLSYEKGKTYPLLVFVHGGPMGFFEESFLGIPSPYPLAAFAEAGFFVFRPNPRGSCGYGKTFRCANYQDWGGKDLQDILLGVDHLIAQGIVDPKRLGIMGWSYGGYMASWAVTQTTRFQAASIGAGVSNLASMNGTTDLHRFIADYLGDYLSNRELYENRSPINYADRVETPCLIQHGTADARVPVSQAYELYHALDRLGKTAKLLLYPGMEHRIFDPNMQLDAMRSNLEWFETHLLEKK